MTAEDTARCFGEVFREAVQGFDGARRPLVLGHFDADGLSAAAILARALERAGRPADIRLVGKGENPWSAALWDELAKRAPGGLVVADLGVREGEILPGVATVLIDHHVPTGTPGSASVISGNGIEP